MANADRDIDIAAGLAAVHAEIEAAAASAARDPAEISLIAVSKTKGAGLIAQALETGNRVFGENRVQEAEEKWQALRETAQDLELHLIGPLQTNKIRKAIEIFDVIQTVDRPKLARALAKEIDKLGKRPGCFIQVNTGEEPQKAGIVPGDADSFVKECREVLDLPVAGLMCIPPIDEEPALHFALLRDIASRNGLSGLSMGMSADYPVAVAFGATHVRVGTAIFGARPKPAV